MNTEPTWGPPLRGTGRPFPGYRAGEAFQYRLHRAGGTWDLPDRGSPTYPKYQYRFHSDSDVYKHLDAETVAEAMPEPTDPPETLRDRFAMAALPYCLARNYGNDWARMAKSMCSWPPHTPTKLPTP